MERQLVPWVVRHLVDPVAPYDERAQRLDVRVCMADWLCTNGTSSFDASSMIETYVRGFERLRTGGLPPQLARQEVQAGTDGPRGAGYVIAAPGAQFSCARGLAAIKCSADWVQLDTVSYPLPSSVGAQSWSVQPSRQR